MGKTCFSTAKAAGKGLPRQGKFFARGFCLRNSTHQMFFFALPLPQLKLALLYPIPALATIPIFSIS